MSAVGTTDANKVLKAGTGYVIGNYLLKGITFLSTPIFTRLLTTAEYGDFNIYISYEAIIYILVGIALHSSINNAKYKYGDRLDEYVSSLIVLLLSNTIIWYIGANLLYGFFANIFGFDRVVLNILIFHCLCSSLLQIFNVYVSLTYSVKSFLKVTSFNGIANIIISLILIPTIFSESRCLGRIVGTVIPIGIIGIYIVGFFFSKSIPKVNLSYWKYGLKYSLPIVPHGISQVILSLFDRIMIRDMIGSDEAGIYSFASTVYSLFKVATTSLENVWKPWVYEKMENAEYDSLRRQGTKYSFGVALFASMTLLASPELVKILGDKEYWGATPCVVPILLGGYFAFLYTLPSLIEYFYSKTKYIAIGTTCAAIINIILNFFFIPRYGYIAAAYTTLVTYMLYFAFHYFLSVKIQGHSIFNLGLLILVSLAVIAVGALAIILEEAWAIRWLLLLVIGIYSLYWCEKELGILSKLRAKVKND